MTYNVGASLKSFSKGVDQMQWNRNFVMSQFVFRLSEADHEERMLLKGGLIWWMEDDLRSEARPTTDIDIHFHDPSMKTEVIALIQAALQIERDDQIFYTVESVADLKHSGEHKGVRIKMSSRVTDPAKGPKATFTIDIGFGGTKPAMARREHYASRHPKLQGGTIMTMPAEYIFAEKFSAMVLQGNNNTRLKDYNDMYALLFQTDRKLNRARLAEAIAVTFADRGQVVPAHVFDIEGLSAQFCREHQEMWETFLQNSLRTDKMPVSLYKVVEALDMALMEILPEVHGYRAEHELDSLFQAALADEDSYVNAYRPEL